MGTELVRLRTRPSRNGRTFAYVLDYIDEDGVRRRESLGHKDKRRAERQRAQKIRELKMGFKCVPSMRLSAFKDDCLERTGDQIRPSTRREYEHAMEHFIEVVGDLRLEDVRLKHGEHFRQACLDKGYSRATVAKKLRHLKRMFALAVKREQLEANTMQSVDMPKTPKKRVKILTADECHRILKAAAEGLTPNGLRWDLLIRTALTTGMRRGELLNAVWRDIDFADQVIHVVSKTDTGETWRWEIKDADERTLPLTDDLVAMLTEHQSAQPEGYPYVFLPPARYDRVQELQRQGRWTFAASRQKLALNFTREFRKILNRAGIRRPVKFHDLRRTALSGWLANGLGEYDVMILAGHASFQTTHEFYLSVKDDLVARARKASFGARLARAEVF